MKITFKTKTWKEINQQYERFRNLQNQIIYLTTMLPLIYIHKTAAYMGIIMGIFYTITGILSYKKWQKEQQNDTGKQRQEKDKDTF